MGVHAPLAPSGSGLWGNCSGAYQAQLNISNPDTVETRTGTAAHWVFSEVIYNHKDPMRGGPLDCWRYYEGVAPNGVVIDASICEGAQTMVDEVLKICFNPTRLSQALVEQRVYMPAIHPHNWGTLDAALYLPNENCLIVWDYKHGHLYHSPVGHLQLIDYVQGLVELYNLNGADEQRITVVLKIVQPFCYYKPGTVREWRVKLSDLRPYWNQLADKAHEAFNNPKLSSGPWCRDCLARINCPAVRLSNYSLIHLANMPYSMDLMDGRALSVEREILRNGVEVAKKRLEAIEEQLLHNIMGGDDTSNYTTEAVEGRQNWSIPAKQAAALMENFGVDITKPDVLTPKQSVKKTPVALRKQVERLLKQFTTAKTKFVLVEKTESRTARAFKPTEE